jgi:hypothetical protein
MEAQSRANDVPGSTVMATRIEPNAELKVHFGQVWKRRTAGQSEIMLRSGIQAGFGMTRSSLSPESVVL